MHVTPAAGTVYAYRDRVPRTGPCTGDHVVPAKIKYRAVHVQCMQYGS